MPLEKQSLNNFLPDGFETLNQEGYKENFSADKIKTGYEKDIKDRVSGPNFNNLIDVVGKNTNTLNSYVEYLNGMPINNVPTVNEFNQLDYTNLDDKLTKKQITNCILEIPQRIKVELNDGVLTLKAGSEVIVPNGFEDDGTTPKFDYVTVPNDTSWSETYTVSTQCYILYDITRNTIDVIATTDYNLAYNTATNLMTHTALPSSLLSLPVGLAHRDTTGIGGLDQVFNGIGYIGSTIWVDKGVKGLIPNGRNEDGTLNNIEYTVESLRTVSQTASNSNLRRLFMGVGNWGACFNYNYFEGKDDEKPTTTTTAARVYYAYDTNIVYISHANTTTWEKRNFAQLCGFTCSTTAVLTLSPKTTFRAVDYNDKQNISGWGMPSGKYINLTLGSTGADYIAPANGWVTIGKKNSGAGQLVEIRNISSADLAFRSEESTSNRWVMTSCPVKRGDTFRVAWTAGGELGWFRFVYAQGEV